MILRFIFTKADFETISRVPNQNFRVRFPVFTNVSREFSGF